MLDSWTPYEMFPTDSSSGSASEPDQQHQPPDRLARERARAEEQERDDRDTDDERDDCWDRKHETR